MVAQNDIMEVKKQKNDLLKLILRKTDLSYRELITMAKEMYISANLEVVTPAEKRQFTKLAL